jgi:hypothetical protein
MTWWGIAYYVDWLLFTVALGGSLLDVGGHIFQRKFVEDLGNVIAVFTWFALLVVAAVEVVVWGALNPIFH